MGSITENSPLGIRGMLNDTAGELEGEVYEVAYKQDIALGKAYIISEVSGERVEYEIEIESLDYSGDEENKGILFKVTDERLLGPDRRNRTGDERQSDYPERKKMIGAVTHVFVSDASMGYGIFIEKNVVIVRQKLLQRLVLMVYYSQYCWL